MKSIFFALLAGSFILGVGCLSGLSNGQEPSSGDKLMDAAGNLKMPSGYRETYQFLGTWGVAADAPGKGSKQLHNVYASPGTIEAFQKSGRFPDGTVLVKEVFAAKSDQMTTGLVSHPDTLEGWFLLVKESKNLHPENKLWGDGWVWSWFDADKPNKTTSTDYKKDCKSCHVPAQASDWIYSTGFPTLKK